MPLVTASVSPTSISTQVQQLGNGNASGVQVNPPSPTTGNQSPLGFFGATPAAQASGLEAAVSTSLSNGTVATFATTATPASVATLTSAEVTLTPSIGSGAAWAITTTDLVVINKPTSQAGLGYGNVRYASATTVALTFNNISAGTLTPTTTQIYGIVGVRGLNKISQTLTPASVAASTSAEQQFNVAGVVAGQLLMVNKPTVNAGLDIVNVRVVSNGVVGITYANFTAATLTPTSEAYLFSTVGNLVPASNQVIAQIPIIGGTVATVTTADITVTSGNFNVQDIVAGISKPTLQAGLAQVSARLASSTTIAITYVNPTGGTLTPTAAEDQMITINRENPTTPLVLYSATLTPASVATATTAEQTFAVTGIVAASMLAVNGPVQPPGVGIVGCRVSSAGNVALNFLNTTTGTLTPTSGTYLFGNFQMLIDTTTANSWVQPVAAEDTGAVQLTNALRTALVSYGLIAGA